MIQKVRQSKSNHFQIARGPNFISIGSFIFFLLFATDDKSWYCNPRKTSIMKNKSVIVGLSCFMGGWLIGASIDFAFASTAFGFSENILFGLFVSCLAYLYLTKLAIISTIFEFITSKDKVMKMKRHLRLKSILFRRRLQMQEHKILGLSWVIGLIPGYLIYVNGMNYFLIAWFLGSAVTLLGLTALCIFANIISLSFFHKGTFI